MLRKKSYLPIGFLLLATLIGGFLFLYLQPSQEPVKIYRVVEPSTEGEHIHKNGTFHADPHSPTPATLEPDQETQFPQLQKKVVELQRQLKEAEQRKKEAEAVTAAAKAELKALREGDAEFSAVLSTITEKAREIAETNYYAAVLDMTPEKFIGLSESDKEDFLLHCADYDLAVDEIKRIIASSPQWVIDKMRVKRPETIDAFMNAPSLTLIYGRL